MSKYIVKLKPGISEFDMLEAFRGILKIICVGDLSYEELGALGVEDVLVDRNDPAGIVYKIVVAAWEGEGGM